jgi:membrane protein implicated in regulation of membrane protease activity
VLLLLAAIAGLFILPDPWRFIVLGAVALFEVAEVWFWITFLMRYHITTGVEGMIGEVGQVLEDCDPTGRVRLRGEIWNARCTLGAGSGTSVRVAGVDSLTLVVEPLGSDSEPRDRTGAEGGDVKPAGAAGRDA